MNKMLQLMFVIAALVCTATAYALPNPDASSISIKTDCGADPACFNTTSDALNWVYTTRLPSASNPLVINIGAGTFGTISCNGSNNGYITFKGAGKNQTKLSGFIAANFSGCKNIAVQDMTLAGNIIGITWFGGGNSTWTNVDVTANYAAWYDAVSNSGDACPVGNQGTHQFFSSTFSVTNATFGQAAHAFFNSCGKNWFFGSQVNMNVTAGGNATQVDAIFTNGAGNEVHLYGSNVRVTTDSNAPLGTQTGITSTNNGEVHLHGTGVDVIAENGNTAVSLAASAGGIIHANGSAYVLKTGPGGQLIRVSNNGGNVSAPYLWQAQATPPNIESQNGSDMVVINSGQPHMVIFSSGCASHWYDPVAKSCF